MKRFNTTGTCRPNEHYMVDITERVEIIRKMVAQGDYFCINRGRQYGKTTTLEALNVELASEYTVFKLSFEGVSPESFASLPVTSAYFLKSLLFNVRFGLTTLDDAAVQILEKAVDGKDSIADMDFAYTIPMLCKANSKPIVILIDEVDQAGNYESFLLFLGVLRKMYLNRAILPTFQSVILAGVYDIKNLQLKMRSENEHQYNSPWNVCANESRATSSLDGYAECRQTSPYGNIAVPFDVDMSLSADGIKGMLNEYEADHHKGIDTEEVASWIREYTSGYPFLVSRLCQLMDEQDDWSHEGFLNAVKALLNERNTLFDDMVKKIEQFSDLKSLLKDHLFSGESRKYNPLNKAFQLAERFNIINIHNSTFSIACRIMETAIYEYFMAEENESEYKYSDLFY